MIKKLVTKKLLRKIVDEILTLLAMDYGFGPMFDEDEDKIAEIIKRNVEEHNA